MSDGLFYWWLRDTAMTRRSLLALLGAGVLGGTGVMVLDDNDDDSSSDDSGATPTTEPPPSTQSSTAEPTETATAEPTATATPTAEPTETATPTPSTNRELQRNLDVSSRGFADDGAYRVLYSIGNRNDVAVSVTFEATVRLQNGTELRRERTATIDPGQAATDEFVFDEYESSPTGYGFRPVRTVEA
jgi:hypothetical protein